MLVTKHPNSDLLIDYASGALSPALCVSVSSHLHFCATCRDKNQELTGLGGSLLETAEPAELTISALDDVLGRLDEIEPPRPFRQVTLAEDENKLPELVKNLLPDDGPNWKFLSPALRVARLAVGEDKYELALHKIKAGGKTPAHDHDGVEITVVLQGSFSDADGIYHEGDFIVREPGDIHRPTASQNNPCICLSVSEAPIKLVGPFKRLLNPLFSVTPR
ncbi:MAG: putative transcriptional regulator [Candidatus Azotimanducaceae bacterium]|jgi:putative transcriptional regulator